MLIKVEPVLHSGRYYPVIKFNGINKIYKSSYPSLDVAIVVSNHLQLLLNKKINDLINNEEFHDF